MGCYQGAAARAHGDMLRVVCYVEATAMCGKDDLCFEGASSRAHGGMLMFVCHVLITVCHVQASANSSK